ncbi:MAG: hypothetical protein ACKN9K_13590, partial [Dolichospermum sp.]
ESTPLQQAQLTPQEEAVFDSDRISGHGLQFSQLTRPDNIATPPIPTINHNHRPDFDGREIFRLYLPFAALCCAADVF